MNVTEFVSRAMSDRHFLVEAFGHVPQESLQVQVPESERGDVGGVLAKYLWPYAEDEGLAFTEDELRTECARQTESLKGLARVRLAGRIVKSVTKAIREREQ